MHTPPWLLGDACAVSVAPTNNVATAMVSFMTSLQLGRALVTKLAMILQNEIACRADENQEVSCFPARCLSRVPPSNVPTWLRQSGAHRLQIRQMKNPPEDNISGGLSWESTTAPCSRAPQTNTTTGFCGALHGRFSIATSLLPMGLTDSIGGRWCRGEPNIGRSFQAVSGPRFQFKWRPSDPIASLPGKKNESCDQRNHDKHPVLTFETQKSKMLNEKLHSPAPFYMQDKRFLCAG